jgi:alginate O-acetyltransferase complex protein AlgI
LNFVLIPVGRKLSELAIILPIGISFYTFGILSYVIDVYRGHITPAKSLLNFTILITFFPRLISGPITRAKQFLPQIEHGMEINFPNLMEGIHIFLQGLIKKAVIADTLGLMVDEIYTSPSIYSTETVWLGVLAYSVQVFCDFSGYIDMARGISKVLGFDLPINFNFPFTAQTPSEFWRRWNISLTDWFRDYIFIPLEMKRRKVKYFRMESNMMFVFLLTGLWHGASWNFVLWGGLHGLYLILERWITKRQRRPKNNMWKTPSSWLRACLMYILVSVTMVLFRSPTIIISKIILEKLIIYNSGGIDWFYQPALIFVPIIVVGGWIYRLFLDKVNLSALSYPVQFSVMALTILAIYFFAAMRISPFIYFRF